jgi:hypothetical protein
VQAAADDAEADESACYGDNWMAYVVAIVPIGDEGTVDALVCTFVDELRRAHGFIDVILEGPMGASRTTTQYILPTTATPLAASGPAEPNLTGLASVSVKYSGYVSIQCTIDNGAGGAPSDTPLGSWELYTSADGTNYTKVSEADVELAKIAPNGNNKVDAVACFNGVPGSDFKVRYNRTSGGAGDSRVRMQITAW